jgi:hypothetical protein
MDRPFALVRCECHLSDPAHLFALQLNTVRYPYLMMSCARINPDSVVGPDAEARSKPFVAKPIHSASDRTSISGACALPELYKPSAAKRAKMTLKLHAWVSSLLQARPSLSR